MKKIIILALTLLITLFILVGCSLSNTPTSKVEELFNKYQTLDDDIKKDIDSVLDTQTLTSEQKNKYRELIENQYKNLTYEIKNETIDGDIAIITTQIEVLDYRKSISELNTTSNTNFDILEYNDEKIKKLESVKEKVAYTLDIKVIKDSDGNWKLSSLSDNDKKKILGMY